MVWREQLRKVPGCAAVIGYPMLRHMPRRSVAEQVLNRKMEADEQLRGDRTRRGERVWSGIRHGKDHLRLLPPSANWYCAKICDWGRSDDVGLLLAFGAKNSVFIYQVAGGGGGGEDSSSGGDAVKLSFFAQLVRGKRDRRVTAVQFLTDTTGELRLVCGGEEGSVQIWDVATLTMIEQHRKHKAEVMAVTVSGLLDANFVVAGDRQGRISAWERDAGKVSVFMPISGDGIHSMAVSPHDKTLIAVGYRSGVLCLVDAAQGTVRYRLAGHDQEVQCVAWKATDKSNHSVAEDEEGAESGSAERDVWLASSSRDKTIKLWKLASDSAEEPVLEQLLRLPTGKQGMSFTQTKQLWLPVAWSVNDNDRLGRHCLWSGSFDGSLLRWEWSAGKSEGQGKKGKKRVPCKPVAFKGGHNRMLFSIVMTPPRGTTLPEDGAASMLTVSLDRELRIWRENPSSKSAPAATCVEKLTGLGGHGYSVSYNAATGIVAAGVGDQTIRLWNLGADAASVPSDYQCDLLWKGLQSKVTCVRWHPFQHSLLAYGTEDGRIGVYDTQTNKYSHFLTSHDRDVQQLQWIVLQPKKSNNADDGESSFLESIKQLEAAQAKGLSLEEVLTAQEKQAGKTRDGDGMRVLLWSCDTGGTLLESNADASDQKSREVVSGCVSFDWDEQRELLAIGRSNGVAEVLKWDEGIDTSRAKLRFHEHLEGVTCMAWSDAGLLASGGEDGKIFVYSCGNANTPEAPDTAEHGQDSRVLSSIAAHSNKITGLKWCPDLAQGCLASCSSDGSVQIWDATSLQRKVYFNHHVGRVLSLEWVSPYTLVTGGEDQTLRLWDRREQPQDPPSKLKKPGKVKQPQEVEVITALPEQFDGSQQTQVEANTTDIVLGPSSADRSKTIAPSKTKKKAMTIFHPETKLTPIEVAIACRQISGVEKANDSIEVAVGMKPAEAALLTNTDRVQLRDFFASEAKRFREEREWENLANTLVLQGNVIEALGIVAKEGALSPAWLSYAPMAGMDVWREMTNLYAHQLDAQGDKKAAALHFLSIAKVRSAVTCLVSGDAYKEALALIRSRLGPNDPLLLDTLQKYSQFLVKRCRHGEAALALLSIGSVKATTRAIHMLVNTSDMIYVKAALDVLLAAVDSPTKINHHGENFENGDEELSFPASLFISIAGQALVKSRFDVAETAARLLQSPLVGASSSPLHRLTWCLLGIVRAIDEHKISHDNDGLLGLQLGDLLEPDSPPGISEFFEFLTSPHQHREESSADILYSRVLDEFAGETQIEGKSMKSSRTGRADHFWIQILSVCRGGGYWFDGVGNVRVQEAQDLLVEANCLGDIEKAVDAATTEQPDRSISLLLQVAQTLLRFMIDVMSGSFIGALEHMRETFRLLAQSGDMDRADYTNSASDTPSAPGVGELCLTVMTLLFPCGFASPKVLPQCGELADEQLDTLVLWSSILLLQCRIVLATAVLTAKNSSTEDVAQSLESLVRSLLHLLRVSFLGQELCEGLKDAENQSQLQTLLNEMVVASQLLPDGPSTSQVQNVDSSAGEVEQDDESKKCVSRKQALINDTDDLRSCLTWSEDGVK